jgi:hypothetical protein
LDAGRPIGTGSCDSVLWIVWRIQPEPCQDPCQGSFFALRARLPAGGLIRVGGSASTSPEQGRFQQGRAAVERMPIPRQPNEVLPHSRGGIEEPDAPISPFRLFAGPRSAGNPHCSGRKLKQFFSKFRTGPDAKLVKFPDREFPGGHFRKPGTTASWRDAGPDQRAAADQAAP